MGIPETSEYKYSMFCWGNRIFLQSIAIPLVEILEDDFKNDDSQITSNEFPDYLKVDSIPTMDAGIVIAGIVGVFAFFASWVATKALDEIYKAKFQPAIKKALRNADKKFKDDKHPVPKMLQLGISYADKNIFILIGIVGDTFAEILNSENKIKTVHDNAVKWIESNSYSKPIHLYIMNKNYVNINPLLFENLNMAMGHIKTLDLTVVK